jgi:methylmalonyl-CoA mutase
MADPLALWAKRGELPCPIAELYDSLAGWTAWAADHAPQLRTVAVDARLWADAGATAVQELAFALAAGAEYVGALNTRGVTLEHLAPRLGFQFAIGPQFFTEIAKFRAWRALWTRVIVAWGAEASLAPHASIHAATCRWNKTRLDPHVNMLRVTTEALSAVLGGCDSLHIAPYDAPSGATTAFSRRIARNVHTLLAEEFGLMQTADPAGGSWYVEKLTDELARKAWALFQTIQTHGGFQAALEAGFLQKQVESAAAEKTDAVGRRRVGLVGTNLFPNLKDTPPQDPRPTPAVRTPASVAPSPLSGTVGEIHTWNGRFEFALSAADRGASVAQLLTVAHRNRPDGTISTVSPWRAAAGFERLRAASDAYAGRTGKRPQVFLAKMGPAVQHKARADFSAGFFAIAGCEILAKQSFDTATAAAEAAAASGAPIAVLCSTDETYGDLVPAFAAALKARRHDIKVILAGLPADPAVAAAYRAAGVDEFIHLRANAEALLDSFLKQIGATA